MVNKQLKYFSVALCGFLIDFLIYSIIVVNDGNIYFANVAGFCMGATINVVLIRIFVFPNSRYKLLIDLLLTIFTNSIMLVVGMLILWFEVNVFSMNPYWAKCVANSSTFFLNYATRSTFFKKK
jgi:putative flippase GtrA